MLLGMTKEEISAFSQRIEGGFLPGVPVVPVAPRREGDFVRRDDRLGKGSSGNVLKTRPGSAASHSRPGAVQERDGTEELLFSREDGLQVETS